MVNITSTSPEPYILNLSLTTMPEHNEASSADSTTDLLEKMRRYKRGALLESSKNETPLKSTNQTKEAGKTPAVTSENQAVSVKNQVELYLPNEDDSTPIEFFAREHQHERLRPKPMYFEAGLTQNKKILGRKGVFTRLTAVLEDRLLKKYGIQVWDCYRPIKVQRELYKRQLIDVIFASQSKLTKEEIKIDVEKYMSEPSKMTLGEIIEKSQSALTEEKIIKQTNEFVSPPSTSKDPAHCSPHLSGGAIDLTLYDTETGQELNMGTDFDEFREVSHSEYFEFKDDDDLTEKMKTIRGDEYKHIHKFFKTENGEDLNDEAFKKRIEEIRDNRRVLRNAMTAAGFAPYEYEWWHFDLGDRFWGNFWKKIPALMVEAEFEPLFYNNDYPTQRCSSSIFFRQCVDIDSTREIPHSSYQQRFHEKYDFMWGRDPNKEILV